MLPGSPTAYEGELRALAEELGVAGRVRFPDWLSDEELAALYGLSSAFVLPSLIEGFGIPVLEAMAHGVPVACSNVSALPEVAGDAALLFDPERQEEVTGAIRRLLDDPRARRAPASRAGTSASRASRWERTGAREPRRLSPRDRRALACRLVPRVLIVRGHQVTPWELRPWQELPERFEVAFLLTGSNRFAHAGGSAAGARARAARPAARRGARRRRRASAWATATSAPRRASRRSTSCTPRSSPTGSPPRPRGASARHGFRLVQTVWETLPHMVAYRNRHARRYRELVLAETDLFLPATERAAAALRLEGVEEERIHVCAAGDRRRALRASPAPDPPPREHTILSPGRLVWEKGHHDVLRALAALHRGIVTLRDGGAQPSRRAC